MSRSNPTTHSDSHYPLRLIAPCYVGHMWFYPSLVDLQLSEMYIIGQISVTDMQVSSLQVTFTHRNIVKLQFQTAPIQTLKNNVFFFQKTTTKPYSRFCHISRFDFQGYISVIHECHTLLEVLSMWLKFSMEYTCLMQYIFGIGFKNYLVTMCPSPTGKITLFYPQGNFGKKKQIYVLGNIVFISIVRQYCWSGA